MNDDEPDNVVPLPGGQIPAGQVLRAAMRADLNPVLVLGYEPNGKFYMASNIATAAYLVLALERAKRRVIETVEAQEQEMGL